MWFCWSSAAASPSMVLVVSVTASRSGAHPCGSPIGIKPTSHGEAFPLGPLPARRWSLASREAPENLSCPPSPIRLHRTMWLPRRDMTGGPTPRRSPARVTSRRGLSASARRPPVGGVAPRRTKSAGRNAGSAPSARCPGRERKTRAARGWGRAMSRPTPGLRQPEAYAERVPTRGPTPSWTADGPRNRSPDPRRRLAPDPARRRACPGRRRARRPVRAPPGAWLRASGRVRRRGQRAESDEFSRPGPGPRRARPRPALPPCAGPRRVPCHGQGIRAGPACRAARSRPTDGAGAREMTRFSPTRLENTAKVGLPPGAVHGLGARAGAGLRPNASAPRPGRRHTGTAAIAEAQGDAVAATDMVFV